MSDSAASTRRQLAAILVLACLMSACSSRSAGSTWNVEGPIRAIDGSVWIVGDRLVTIAPDARIVGSPAIGSVAQVRGSRNEHGSPIGESVEITSSPPTTTPPATRAPPPPTAPPPATPPQAPVSAPAPAPTAGPASQPKPQAVPDRDADKDDDKKDKEEKERRGPPARPGGEQKTDGKPKGR